MSKFRMIVLLLISTYAGVYAQSKRVEVIKGASSITYRLSHLLHTVEAVSKEFTCRLEIDPANKEIQSVTAQVDVTTFDSGNSNRDSHAMEVVDAMTYPYASFISKSISQQGDSITVTGQLTFHGVKKDVVMKGVTKWFPKIIDIDGEFAISLTAFQIERPSLLMVPVSDELVFTLKATFAF
ncbi:MAG: YceI family protein [Ignavibacteriae bacterium]|nr:MAG: YceI family protein [Ignavibacteriota bacterium]